jgi:hypothetical protein
MDWSFRFSRICTQNGPVTIVVIIGKWIPRKIPIPSKRAFGMPIWAGCFYASLWIFPSKLRIWKKTDLLHINTDIMLHGPSLRDFFAPALIGWMLGSFWGGFWILGALRIVLTQQSTFFVNSLCHTLGQQTYSDKISARDSLLVAFLTHGEGYHNFHHTFQSDYRNGIRWYQWDPTKWTIWTLSILGLTKKLKTISSHEILKARLHMEELRLKRKGICHERIDQLRNRVLSAQASFKRLHDDYEQMKKNLETASQQKVQQLRIDLEVAKLEFQNSLQQWKTMYQLSLNGL